MVSKTNFNDAQPGDKCSNGAWETRFTCPGCYTDHDSEVTQCEGCGVALRCEIEQQPIPVCYIADPSDNEEED